MSGLPPIPSKQLQNLPLLEPPRHRIFLTSFLDRSAAHKISGDFSAQEIEELEGIEFQSEEARLNYYNHAIPLVRHHKEYLQQKNQQKRLGSLSGSFAPGEGVSTASRSKFCPGWTGRSIFSSDFD
jgi:hypothetical protein